MPISCNTAGQSCDCANFGISAELSDNTGCAGSQGPQGEPGAPGSNGNITLVGSVVGNGDPNGRLSANIGDNFKDTETGELWTNMFGGTNWGYG